MGLATSPRQSTDDYIKYGSSFYHRGLRTSRHQAPWSKAVTDLEWRRVRGTALVGCHGREYRRKDSCSRVRGALDAAKRITDVDYERVGRT